MWGPEDREDKEIYYPREDRSEEICFPEEDDDEDVYDDVYDID